MNNSLKSSSSFMSSSNVAVSSSSVRATSAHSSSASVEPSSGKATPRVVRPLKERTSVKDVNNKVRDISITEKNGSVVTAQLMKPSYADASRIDDARQAVDMRTRLLEFTTVRFQKKLFKIFRNVEVNGKPTSGMNYDLADSHLEAFQWFIDQANSFLRDKFTTD